MYIVKENHKRCYQCKNELPISRFHNNKNKTDGKCTVCKDCMRDVVRKNKQNNRERTSKQQQEYLMRHKNNNIFNEIQKEKHRLNSALIYLNVPEKRKTIGMNRIGCSRKELAEHLQQTAITNGYNDFNIYNYDRNKYHTDHIIPFKAAQDGIVTLEEVCHYSNIQILLADDNFTKHMKY